MSLLLQSLVTGILLGGLYAFLALGLTLIFGVMRIINLFHGELVMLGMFMAFWLWQLFGIDPIVSVILVAPALFLVGMLLHRFLIHP
ncbi:MAG: branched-chain amino acid ABC transporter permease, partial [Dehalococcoidia bacterium]|nr:branched-chain amino acid ABC transporter permease [Dehalococcoidia bacterium]